MLSKEQAAFSKEFTALPVKKIEELLVSTAPAMHMVDRESLAICISALIGKYLNFIRCSDCMDQDTTYETACMMIDTHPHLPVDAIKTFFYECKRGTYGFHYNKMDGTKLLMWFDRFVDDYYKRLDDMEFEKHQQSKDGLTEPLELECEDGTTINALELLASFHGKTPEEMERERKVKEIRFDVEKRNIGLYSSMPVEEADKAIEQAIIEEMKKQGLLTF